MTLFSRMGITHQNWLVGDAHARQVKTTFPPPFLPLDGGGVGGGEIVDPHPSPSPNPNTVALRILAEILFLT
jgi:hypothetical protein